MIRNLHRWFGWTACSLGLLLVSQLAQAGSHCVSVSSDKAAVSHAAMQVPCVDPVAANDLCAANPSPIDAAAKTSPSPKLPLPAAALASGAAIALARAKPVLFAGPAPGFRLPLHILFHRYLI